MAKIKGKTLFFTTSPRTPQKMIPEIALLDELFAEKPWNTTTQEAFMNALVESPFYESQGTPKDPALSARDRITRAPKALGFVDLKPVIALTDAGKKLISGKRTEEVILRQLLKFQLPSPYHTSPDNGVVYWVRPYLELLRLVNTLGKTHCCDELLNAKEGRRPPLFLYFDVLYYLKMHFQKGATANG